jgi:SAM-dependent MidA family methyltransferase
MRPADLPVPDSAALAASDALRARIRAAIRESAGWIPFSRYMSLVLHEPELGYYSGGSTKLGVRGDFVTAPEMGPLFGRTLARHLSALFGQTPSAILELGAGSGALAATLIDALPGVDYSILETSAELTARQRERLGGRVRWLTELPAQVRGAVIANEVVDALPVAALAWTANGVFERGVVEAGDGFAWEDRPAQGVILDAARAIGIDVPPSGRYESELGLAARAWIGTLGERLAQGEILVIDYGFPQREFYHPQRSMGTLMCHYRHRSHGDVFLHPGLQDITAHVDFTALAHAANTAGLDLLGYASQANFLADCGITEVLAGFDPGDAKRYLPRASEAQALLSPAEMGELFKVLALGRGVRARLPGFAGDRRHSL